MIAQSSLSSHRRRRPSSNHPKNDPSSAIESPRWSRCRTTVNRLALHRNPVFTKIISSTAKWVKERISILFSVIEIDLDLARSAATRANPMLISTLESLRPMSYDLTLKEMLSAEESLRSQWNKKDDVQEQPQLRENTPSRNFSGKIRSPSRVVVRRIAEVRQCSKIIIGRYWCFPAPVSIITAL